MATAYLLASVLTLLVVLVQGQKAIHEQEIQVKTDKLVEFADDIFEDELNSDIDVLLLDSANTRAECNQKKKCKNKGGTCQNKGNACAGKSVKGCSKGCSCCLPEEILCKPSKKCKRANGACISRSECNGKIVAKGCKKPKNCKRTHVCCVQDGSTTEVPTCSGGSRCLTTDEKCPGSKFPENYVCEDCTTQGDANKFMNRDGFVPAGTPYLMFGGKTSDGEPISYTSISADKCKIEKRVQAWSCKKKNTWSCSPQGFCTAEIKKVGDIYKPDGGTLKCTCPNPFFEKKHVCPDCENSDNALDFVEKGKPPTAGNVRDVLTGLLNYVEITQGKKKLCLVTNPTEVLSWKCIPKTDDKTKFDKCVDIGYCTNLRSLLHDGHFEYDDKICYHVHFGKIWDDKCESLKTILTNPDTAATCMKECKKEVAAGCNAFNYKVGESCILKKCPTAPYPNPIPSTDGYDAYYQLPGYYVNFGEIWEDQCTTLATIINDPDTAANCMMKCTKKAGCNAFNYKVGEPCVLKDCSTPYPNPSPSTDGYDAYYWLPASTAAESNIADDED